MNKKVLLESLKGTGYQRVVKEYLWSDDDDKIMRELQTVMSKHPEWEMVDAGGGEVFYNNGDKDLYIAIGTKGIFDTKQ